MRLFECVDYLEKIRGPFKDTMGLGMAPLQHASRLDNPNHAEAGCALPPAWTLRRRQNTQEIVRYQYVWGRYWVNNQSHPWQARTIV